MSLNATSLTVELPWDEKLINSLHEMFGSGKKSWDTIKVMPRHDEIFHVISRVQKMVNEVARKYELCQITLLNLQKMIAWRNCLLAWLQNQSKMESSIYVTSILVFFIPFQFTWSQKLISLSVRLTLWYTIFLQFLCNSYCLIINFSGYTNYSGFTCTLGLLNKHSKF